MSENKVILYKNANGGAELYANVDEETLWATQDQMALLFEVSRPNITLHIKNLFNEQELERRAVSKDSLLTGKDGKKYAVTLFNLDVIIAVGYRVNSKRATEFRIWSAGILREYIMKGYSLNNFKLESSPKNLEDIDKAITLLKSEELRGRLKGKITVKLSKDLV